MTKRRADALRATYTVALLVLAGASFSADVLAGAGAAVSSIKGKVAGWEKLAPQVYAESARSDSHRYTWREPSPTVKQEFRKLSANVARDVCVVALASSGASPREHDPLSVKVTGGRITPATIVLAPGTRLSFKNADPFPHMLYEAGNEAWAPNAVAPGSTREWAATSPGLHVIHDQLFPSVVMYVVVDPTAVEFAFPDHEGAFAINVPPGDYTLKAFFDGKPVGKEAPVHVGGAVEMREPIALAGGDAK